ncbi:sigma 54-interacting transcriptional regulator [Glaciecola sp. SC05]|uniref:sigma 54-interacting transcriptional regulator n=1 Tax=Glaciecola sp. SC05 TaxID=1987355 RepID=UPI003528AF18
MSIKLTKQATEQLLQSIRLLTDSDYLRVSGLEQKDHERLEIGDLSVALLTVQQRQAEEFAVESAFFVEQLSIALSVSNKQRMLICIHKHTSEQGKQQRRQTIIQTKQERQIEIELLTEQVFPNWLLNLAHSENSQINTREQQQLLHLCACLYTSTSVFAQFQGLTVDSLTKLQSRNALQRTVDENITSSGMNLCMIHCRDFQIVNRKFGQAKGDQVLNEIATIINQQTRLGDQACRFGGALFGIVSDANSVDEGLKLAQKLQTELHNRPYLKNAIRLSFNVGVAHITAEDCVGEDASPSSIMISRAEQALKAAQTSDKPSIVHWEADKFKYDEQDFNYIGGIFTPDNVTNYRNMLLLWDISSIIADEHEFARLLVNVVERLAYTFEFSAAGIISDDQYSPFEQAISVSQMADISPLNIKSTTFEKDLRKLSKDAIENGRHVEYQNEQERFLLVPLGAELNACFFLVGQEQTLDLTHDSVMLFAGFARQIGKALKRSQLEDELNRNLEQQNAQLAEELNTIKTGLKSSALVYRSESMQTIMKQTQRAAQTDTTILVTGESGTGKEKLIHAIHNLSPRNKAPLVIVDCGSIPETLIESELFGYVKGAFTGAQSHTVGKIQAADGGIIVLDEIGELPMSMQPKLLRFVQEKHFTPVGSNKAISVDVKIVALTNRDLQKEVQRGAFRQDLYFRLNVVTLHNPPLRDRLEDLELLSQHFLSKFANQFETTRKYLSPQTLAKMHAYHWPGNIRELENKLMQASLMCQGNEILFDDINIQIYQEAERETSNGQNLHEISKNTIEHYEPELGDVAQQQTTALNDEIPATMGKLDGEDWLQAYNQAIDSLLKQIYASHEYYQSEIGTWIEMSLFQLTFQQCRTNKLIASRLQIPISTARRKANKAESFTIEAYPPAWATVAELLKSIASGQVSLAKPLDTLKLRLLAMILRQGSGNMTHAAQLLGVSEPTLYKLKRSL